MAVLLDRISFQELVPLAQEVRKAGLQFYDTENTSWFCAKENGRVVGLLACEVIKNSALIRTGYIKGEQRGKGIFRDLFLYVLEFAESLEVKMIKGYCKPQSVKLFLESGFVIFSQFRDITCVRKRRVPKLIDCKVLCNIITGQVTKGDEEFLIHSIVDRTMYIKTMHSLVFLYDRREQIDWDRVEKFAPCSIVYEKGKQLERIIPHCTYIEVADMQKSYWQFVNSYRDQFDIPVFAITGTCGKTTTKEMIKHILNDKYKVQATRGSNNSFYINLRYLTEITKATDVAVFETPVGWPGLLEFHCRYFKPTIGMITNIGIDHLKQCGSIENYIKAKGEIIKGLNYQGTLLLNADDEKTATISLEEFKGRVVYFGIHQSADYKAEDIEYADGGMKFSLIVNEKKSIIYVPGYGEHQVYNAISAIAAVQQIGMSIEDAAVRLAAFKNIKAHLEVSTGFNKATIIDDTWSSNPTSMEAALTALPNISKNKKKIVLIGTVALLGEDSSYYHREMGKRTATMGADVLITYGEMANEIAKGAVENQMIGPVYSCKTVAEIERILLPILQEDTALLIKASMYDKSLAVLINKLKGQ
jgi:UDP-N-acetylmuramoyl-tripeptide--D-alanyl-D-alanine ligase